MLKPTFNDLNVGFFAELLFGSSESQVVRVTLQGTALVEFFVDAVSKEAAFSKVRRRASSTQRSRIDGEPVERVFNAATAAMASQIGASRSWPGEQFQQTSVGCATERPKATARRGA